MTVSLVSPVRELGRSEDVLGHLRVRLRAESEVQAAAWAEHEALVEQLRDQTDADSVLERELAETGAKRAREAIDDIERALGRIEQGSYGRCERCGAAISLERLEAIPSASSCIACAARRSGRMAPV